ncbi:MAG: ABC transporter substrate-binding protein [Lachnotalea sp.]
MKKRILSVLLAAGMAVSLMGCGSTDSSSSTNESSDSATEEVASGTEATGDVTTIEFWTNNRHDEAYMTEMIDAFNSSHTDVQINYTILTDDWANAIQLAYQGGTAPDIISIQASDPIVLQTYVDAGMFSPITDYVAADTEFQKVTEPYEHMFEGLTSLGDEIYWVPNGVRTGTRIEYNKELVNAAGYTEVPNTLQGVVDLAKAATTDSTYGVGFTSSSPFSRWLEGAGDMSGCNHYGYDYTTGTYDFSNWKELLETAAQLNANASALPGSETQGVDNSRALFAQGAFALWGNASQEAGVFTDQFPCDFEWGVAELPTLTGEVKGALSYTPNCGYALLSSCENKDAAWEVISYFSSEEFLKGYFENGYSIALSDYMTSIVDTSNVGKLADFVLQDYEDVYPTTPSITLEGDDFRAVFWNVVLGFTTADDAIADLNTRYNAALESGLANGSCKRVVVADYDSLHPSAGTVTYETE